MTQPVSLILRKDPVTARQPVPARTPNVAVVYATVDGKLDLLGPDVRDTRLQRFSARYRTRYEIDMGDHRRTAKLTSSKLPAADGIHEFETVLDVGFRVHDPLKVIERNVTDPLAVVYGHIIDVCRPIARGFHIEDFAAAEDAINQRFGTRGPRGGEQLPEGILIYRCIARVTADDATLQHLRTVQDAGRHGVVNTQRHTAAVSDAHRANEIAGIKHAGDLHRRAAEHDAMGRRPVDVDYLIRMHLAQHPEDTHTAVRLLQEYQQAQLVQGDIQQQRIADMFRFLVDKGLVHPVDVDQFRNQAISQVGTTALPPGRQAPHAATITPSLTTAPAQVTSAPIPTAPVPTTPPVPSGAAPASDWDAPLPGAAPATAPAATPTPTPTAPLPAHVVPVYLVLDTSAAVAGVVDGIEVGLARLLDTLGADPDQTRGVHLAIVGAADTATTLHPLARVRADTAHPRTGACGALQCGAVFDHLRQLVSDDVPALKTHQPKVRRPQVIMLVAGAPVDDDTWPAAHEHLTDRTRIPYAPRITAFGTGAVTADTIGRLATSPDTAFAATTTDLGTAVADFFAYTATQLLAYARAALDDQPELAATVPPGFCVAASV